MIGADTLYPVQQASGSEVQITGANARAPFLQNRDARVATIGAEECDGDFLFFLMDPTNAAGSRYSLNFSHCARPDV